MITGTRNFKYTEIRFERNENKTSVITCKTVLCHHHKIISDKIIVIFLRICIHTGSGANPTSIPVGTGVLRLRKCGGIPPL
jgi:hypothetical protein